MEQARALVAQWQQAFTQAGRICSGSELVRNPIRVRDDTGGDAAHDLLFAFAFHAFWPDGLWMLAPCDSEKN